MADKWVKFIQEDGDLKDMLVKVRRTGSGFDTEYDAVFANPMIYKEELGYVKDFKDLDELDLSHHDYVEKSKEDIEEYLKTGEFPYHKQTTQESNVEEHIQLDLPDDDEMEKVFGTPSTTREETPMRTTTSSTSTTSGGDITSRPRRTYDFSR